MLGKWDIVEDGHFIHIKVTTPNGVVTSHHIWDSQRRCFV